MCPSPNSLSCLYSLHFSRVTNGGIYQKVLHFSFNKSTTGRNKQSSQKNEHFHFAAFCVPREPLVSSECECVAAGFRASLCALLSTAASHAFEFAPQRQQILDAGREKERKELDRT